ncbi:phage tail protein [Leptolyngbya ohadii]|uniref:phage tail protein n=1 Tax=Leptolyngbya ohadii TaxID=1962290 RepID=UPI000B5A0976|nr:phage tail protein [Leptolyngbya ohadii]
MSLLPPSVQDERFLTLEKLVERLQAIDLTVLAIYDLDTVSESALYDLADQFNVLGLRGWTLASTTAQRRALIKEAIQLHQKAGTGYAIRRSLTLVGYPNATIEENPPMRYDGSWSYDGQERYEGKRMYGFIVTLDATQSQVSTDRITLIIGLINEWKNARSRLLDLRIGSVSLFFNLLIYDGTWAFNGSQTFDGVKNLSILEDNFTNASNVNIANHSPTFSQPGFTYSNYGENPGARVNGGVLTLASQPVSAPISGQNYRASLTVTIPTGGGFVLLLRRNTQAGEDVRVVMLTTAALRVEQYPGGTVLATASGYTPPANTPLLVEAVLRGASLTVRVGGITRINISTVTVNSGTAIELVGGSAVIDSLVVQQEV